MIEEIFKTLGFKEEEVKTYLSLLDFGACSGAELARKMGMKRPTIYGYLDRLVAGGLVTQSMHSGLRIYVPERTDKIRLIFQRKMEELKSTEKAFERIIPDLEKRSGLNLFQPKIQYFEGHEGIRQAMSDLLNYENTESCIIWPMRSMMDVLTSDYLRYHNITRIRKNISYRAIWERNQAKEIILPNYLGTGERHKRKLRLAPNNFKYDMGIQIYANKVVFLSSRAESYALMIESKEIVDLQLAQFNTIWDISENFELNPKGQDLFFLEIEETREL